MTGSAKNSVTLSVYPSFKNSVQNALRKDGDGTAQTTEEEGKTFFKIYDDYKPLKRCELFVAEFIGTGMLVFLGCMGCVNGITNDTLTHLQLTFSFGLAVMVPVQCFAHISGSHLNPIMTITSFLLGNISLVSSVTYFIAQMAGAVAGYSALLALNPWDFIKPDNAPVGLCSPNINAQITVMQGFGVEFFASLVLVFTACSVWDSRNKDKHDSVPIKFGLTVACLAIVSGHYTGCNMNPARSFGPALINGDWKNHWVYWVAPILASVFGGIFYRVAFQPKAEKVIEAESYPLNDGKSRE